jgi:two-component system, LytTR family, sensor kinase
MWRISRPAVAALVFLIWTFVGLYFATQARSNPAFDMHISWSRALAINLTYYYLWGLCTPVVVFLARRYRFDSKRWPASLAAHAAGSVVLTSAQIVVAETILSFFFPILREGSLAGKIAFAFGVNFHSSLPTYWLILFVYYAFDYYGKYRDREVRAFELEAQLSQASLQALKMQLNPHFLFNTLNSISSLMYSDVESADAMLARLSEFLRMTLDSQLGHEIPLSREMEFIRRYLEIEQIRFEERLAMRFDIESDALSARVPTLALQPLVENAIHHGIAPRPQGGAIEIRAFREGGRLHLSVADDGVGTDGQPRERIGLANTRARLEQLYGAEQRLFFTDIPGGGFRVDLEIPFRVSAEA